MHFISLAESSMIAQNVIQQRLCEQVWTSFIAL
ncbi:hypothetical protein T05_15216 [Trichinella murrelli]|uniref:Uncharacterized protein n=1 Tax=Trichinella murrelli TaxID=144512 RepID=A0A0V0SSG2_9BILA|nr:hypothetical protein T05_15216 [Trichinella murrelli]